LVGINGAKVRGTVAASFGVAQDSSAAAGDVGYFPSLLAAVRYAVDPRLTFSLVERFTRSDDPAVANQFGLRQERQTFNTNTLTRSADGLLDRVATQAYYQLLTFFDGADTTSHILGVDAGIPIGRLMTAKVGYEFSHSETTGQAENETTGHLIWASL